MQNHCNPPRRNKSPRSEANNLEHLNKRLRETAYAASPTSSYAICLRRTYAPSRTAYAWMMLVPPQSKFHHLEKKRGSFIGDVPLWPEGNPIFGVVILSIDFFTQWGRPKTQRPCLALRLRHHLTYALVAALACPKQRNPPVNIPKNCGKPIICHV